ncbi:probable disease resistance protein At4g27220 [Corylus avellana]|uniref:probable disease resistance protein At4g27220 n=1 Tax=Corylus avellana TaxID=13451 RepID=UPI00286B5984|nr:probable disease resistance protein At4g27220 [Corylus avellana]
MECLYAVGAQIAQLFIEPIVSPIVAPILGPIGRWLCYSCNYDSNIETMENQVEILKTIRERVQNSVDSARRNGEEIGSLVTMWLKKVDEITEEAKKVVEDDDRCCNGACLNLWQRHQLSRKAKKIVKTVGELIENCTWTSRDMEYMDFVSRKSTAEGLMEALGDANTKVIGVYGMAGAGKTTLVREVARRAKEKKLFDEVAIAYVTQSPNLTQIQREIAYMLDLKLDAEIVSERADRLKQRLTTHKKILIILDDIWSKLDLEKIGISCTQCKVVLTSRDKNVLSCEMGTQKDFELVQLPQKEAWNLFEKMAGDCVKDPNLRSTAAEVAKECAGLPIALVTVSKALKNKSIHVWKDALQKLRRIVPTQMITTPYSSIYPSIELSYSHLESSEVKDFFLRCAEMHDSINFQDLLKYCYGLSSFEDIDNLEQARNRLYSLVHNLKDKSLLLDCPHSSEHCHMHDVVRYVARFIASSDHNMFVVSDSSGLKKWTDADSLRRCRAFSIRGGDIHELPNKMECSDLRFFYVYGGDCALHIPETFFEGMGKLQVLDLTEMKLPSLPSSLGLLINLQTLCLDHCLLGNIAVIGELKNLVILSLLSSNLSQLPKEIALLTRLRLLDLSKCFKLEVIPPNVLSSLVELEELYMGNSLVQWESEGLSSERNNTSLAELKHLSRLTTLEIHITDVKNLPKDLLFERLERYAISVGDHVWDSSNKREASKILKLKLNTSFQSEVGIKLLLKRTDALYLDELRGVKSLLNQLDREGFQQLKHLHIQNNPEIQYIINLRIPVVAFPSLETFLLKNMMSLEEIYRGQLPLTSFHNLRIVKVEHCDKLKFLFSSSTARGLSQLEELEVRECKIMGAIVIEEGGKIEDNNTSLFPKLRHLALEHLPKLMGFLITQNPFITDAGEIISEAKLCFHIPILHEQVVFPILETLELSSVNLEEIEQNQHPERSSCRLTNTQAASRFENLSFLKVQGSSNIKFLLSLSTARFMVHLKHLHVLECKVVEEILVTEELVIPKVLFPQLECLLLKNLPFLERFCTGSNIEFPSLKKVVIQHCPKLKTFILKPVSSSMTGRQLEEMNAKESPYSVMQSFFNEEVVFPILERLELSSVNLAEIEQNQHPARSYCLLRNTQATSRFENLSYLEVQGMGNIKYILSFSTARFMVQLKHLHVLECEVVEEILVREELRLEEEITPEVLFPRLECLFLKELPILKRFCVGSNIEFPSLENLKIEHCPKLETFISKPLSSGMTISKELKEMSVDETPHNVMQPLFNEESLDTLIVDNCGVEEIVAREKGSEAIARFVFPQITSLCLEELPQLKWFYPGMHASEWPMLKSLTVNGCQKVDIFAFELLSFQETLQKSPVEIAIKQPLFLVDQWYYHPLMELSNKSGVLSSCILLSLQRSSHTPQCRLNLSQLLTHIWRVSSGTKPGG